MSKLKESKRNAEARKNYEWAVESAEAMERKGEPLRRDEAPPRTTQEIPSAPGFPF